MAIRSGFFNSVNGDRKYDASRFAEYFASFIGNGVFPNPSDCLQVISNNDMTITVRPGKAWINGYIMINDDDYILEIEPADGVLNRIDRVVARYDVTDREIRLEVKKGQFSSNPVAPKLQRDADAYELALADIYVGAGVTSITDDNITDLRNDKDLCGKVDSLIAGDVTSLAEALDEHLAEIASKTEFGHVKLSSAVDSTREDLAATPKAVKIAYDKANEKPFVVGTYTGDNSPSRTISLGFRPSAVYVVSRYGHAESGSGGFALDGYSVRTNIGYDIISITSNGFTVYYNPDKSVHSNSNSSSYNPFRYIAFK